MDGMARDLDRAAGNGRGGQPQRPPRAATIYDIAREAGVAASTVSRALSQPQRVNERTRVHIERVADRLGYRPNPIARALPSGRTQTVALIVSDITNPHFFGVIRGAERQASKAGYTLILCNTEESADAEDRHVERLARGVDGFVLAASRLPDRRIRDLAAEMPVTLVNRTVGGVASAVIDQRDGTQQIVEHLVALGHTSIAFLAGPQASWMASQRWRALSAAARRQKVSATRLGPFAPTVAGGEAAADAALDTEVTAVVAHNDLLAIGVLRRFAQRGAHVPRDVSVVGYDDIFGADFCSPSLTTLAGPLDEAGSTAMEVLLDLMTARGRTTPRRDVVLPAHLITRESTGPRPT